MVYSKAKTVAAYLSELPEDRRAAISAVRKVVRRHLPAGYRESINWGMITWAVPLARYPTTYNGQPLCYAALAAQKNHLALYLMNVYQDSEQAGWLKAAYKKAGKKPDMGKSCIRFRAVDDLPLDAIAKIVASTPVKVFIARYEASRKR